MHRADVKLRLNSALPDVRSPPSPPGMEEGKTLNNAGGVTIKIDDLSRLRRFMVLGSETNNYYVSRQDTEVQTADCVMRLLAEGQGARVVAEVVKISQEGRAPKQATGIAVLARCARLGDAATRAAALAALPAVCRTASTLFEFVQRCKELGASAASARRLQEAIAKVDGLAAVLFAAEACAKAEADGENEAAGKASWGRAMRRAVGLWYLDRSPAAVAYQATKYSRRNGWSHADLLRLAHPNPAAHATKRQQLATATAAAAAGAGAGADARASAAAGRGGDPGGKRAVLPPLVAAAAGGGEEEEEQGALEAAMADAAAAELAAGGGSGDRAETAAAAAEAQRVSDMRAVFSFLVNGVLPGQAPRGRRGRKAKAAPPATAPGRNADKPAAADATAAATAAAGTAAADAAGSAASDPAATDTEAAGEAGHIRPEVPEGDRRPAKRQRSSAGSAGTATADANAATVVAARPPALSPVLQYLRDAQRLRTEIRAPPPLVKKPKRVTRKNRRPAHAGATAATIDAALALLESPPSSESESESESESSESEVDERLSRGRLRQRRRRWQRSLSPRPMARAPSPPPSPVPPPPDSAAVAAHAAATAAALEEALALVRRHRFGHEHVGDKRLLHGPELWAAFLEGGMPMTALIRNLVRMTRMGIMARPDCLQRVTARLTDAAALAAARVHPMSLLAALAAYRKGGDGSKAGGAVQGAPGEVTLEPVWEPVEAVAAALEAGFYAAFRGLVPSGKRFLVAMDVSKSMDCAIGMQLTARVAAAALAMCLVRSEPWVQTMAFSHRLVPMSLTADDRLEAVLERVDALPFGHTDCELPMLHALKECIPVDVFVLLTDSETGNNGTTPAQALRRYRAAMRLPEAKLVVLALAANEFSVADPADRGMLDVAGLDSTVPGLVADFAAGLL